MMEAVVIPADAGIHSVSNCALSEQWIPAFAGMTQAAGMTRRGDRACS